MRDIWYYDISSGCKEIRIRKLKYEKSNGWGAGKSTSCFRNNWEIIRKPVKA